ncbi:hypothetical protein ACFX2G_041645 [Malus domestica]
MELSISNNRKNEPITDFKKNNVFAPKVDKTGKKLANEAFTANTTPIKTSSTPIKIFPKNKTKEIKIVEPSRTQDRDKNTLRN